MYYVPEAYRSSWQSLRAGHWEAQFPVRLSVQLVSPHEAGA